MSLWKRCINFLSLLLLFKSCVQVQVPSLCEQHSGERPARGQWLQCWSVPVEPLRWQEGAERCDPQGGVELCHLLRLSSLVSRGTTKDGVKVQGHVELCHFLRLSSLVSRGTTKDSVKVQGCVELCHFLRLSSLVTWGTMKDSVKVQGRVELCPFLCLLLLVSRGTMKDSVKVQGCVELCPFLCLLLLVSRGTMKDGVKVWGGGLFHFLCLPSLESWGITKNSMKVDGVCGTLPFPLASITGLTNNNKGQGERFRGVWNSAISFVSHYWSDNNKGQGERFRGVWNSAISFVSHYRSAKEQWRTVWNYKGVWNCHFLHISLQVSENNDELCEYWGAFGTWVHSFCHLSVIICWTT